MTTKDEVMIEVMDGYKHYNKSNYVLAGLNMCVPKGCIYSLLGPSGCGKTTLLSCIVGLQDLSHGFINMCTITSPLDIGYMPQDIALQTICTIEETFYVYGLLYGLKRKEISKRLEHFNSLLHLPDKNLQISKLSGGQLRRVSLAIALLHSPDTLLLDEPTVGLDPLLRLTIWDYFRHLTDNENKTIVITTHYIDEAKLSDKVGFMRGGRILKEGKPASIMQSFEMTNLDDVFIKLCKQDNSSQFCDKPPIKRINETRSTFTLNKNDFSLNRFMSNVYKDYLWTKRNLILLALLMTLPASQSLLFCLTYGHYPNNFKIGLLTEEISKPSTICNPHKYLRFYEDQNKMKNCSLPDSLSCQFYRNLQKKFHVIIYDSEEEALRDSYKNKVWGWLKIQSNFTEAFITRVIDGWRTEDDIISETTIDVRLDMTNFVIIHYIKPKLAETLTTTLQYLANSCYVNEAIMLKPVRIEKEFYSGTEHSSSGGETVGFLSGFSFYFALVFTSSALFVEKTNGVTNRNRVAGVTFLENVLGHLVIQILMLTLQKIMMLSILYGPFEYSIKGNVGLVLFGLYLLEFVGISLGILFSTFFEATLELNFNIVLFTLAIFFLGGIIWPEEAMHWTLQIFKWTVPGQSMVSSLRNVIVKVKNGALWNSCFIEEVREKEESTLS